MWNLYLVLIDIYQYKDHLGNVRLSYDKTLAIKEESNFYPFGLKQDGYNIIKTGVESKHKFNGKELQDELGLNFYDYGARNYDPALGRWMNIDPLAEKYNSWSGYNYALNNPVLFIDPDGREIDISELMRSKSHAQAFIAFAKTKQGINFLNKYASAGQKLEYGGKVFYQAGKEAGEYDKKGIDINYGFSKSNTTSHTGTDITKDGFVINVDIAKEGFGSDNKVFNLAKAIVHESFLHAELDAIDVSDGMPDNSSVPSEYRKYDNLNEANAQHYYVSREYASGSKSKDVQSFSTESFNALKSISKSLNLNYSDTKIRTIQWDFGGSLIQVDQKTGKTSYKK